MVNSISELTEALEQFNETKAAGAGLEDRETAAVRLAAASSKVLGLVSAVDLVALLIDDDKSVYVQGLYADDDAAMAELRRYLVERFGEGAVVEAEADNEQGFGSLVSYKTDSFPIPQSVVPKARAVPKGEARTQLRIRMAQVLTHHIARQPMSLVADDIKMLALTELVLRIVEGSQ
ncbi:hypothetical protein [Mycobacteroides abscessus]